MIRRAPLQLWLPSLVVVALLVMGLIDAEGLTTSMQRMNRTIFQYFGSFYLWFGLLTLILFLGIGLSPLGAIRLGKPGEKPEHSFFSWVAMLFCCGMGIGFMLWGAGEPLYHYMNPPLDGLASSPEKEAVAFYFTYLHWGLQPWGIYGMTALVVAYFGFVQGRGFSFSAFIKRNESTDNTKFNGFLRELVDFVTIIAIIFGIAATMASGVLVVEGGFQTLFKLESSLLLKVSILTTITVVYLISAANGLDRGIKVLSNVSVIMSLVLLGAMIWLGPEWKMLGTLIHGIPGYIQRLPQLSLGFFQFSDGNWLNEWTIKYWSWWIAWAPFVGMFIAIISRGRTIRELLMAVLVVPTLFSFLWFTVLGETAITLQENTHFMGDTLDWESVKLLMFRIFDQLTHSPILSWLSLAILAIFICNSADSASYIMASFSRQELKSKAKRGLQIAWGILFAVLTMVLLIMGSGAESVSPLQLLQEVTQVTALPFTLLLVVVFINVTRALCSHTQTLKQS